MPRRGVLAAKQPGGRRLATAVEAELLRAYTKSFAAASAHTSARAVPAVAHRLHASAVSASSAVDSCRRPEGPSELRRAGMCEATMITTTATGSSTILRRLIGAATLDVAIYEEVEADRRATAQALMIVLVSSLAAGLGTRGFRGIGPTDVAFFSVVSLMAWAAWALVTYEVGVRIMPGPQTRSDVGELLRTTGFAATPGLLRIFGVVPGLTIPVFAVTTVWMLLTMIVAVRQSLDYTSTGRAVAVCGLGLALSIVFAVVLGLLFGPHLS